MNETLLDAAQAAAYLGMSTKTLKKWRSKGTGPAYSRISHSHSRVRYRKSALDAWVVAHETPTSTNEKEGQ